MIRRTFLSWCAALLGWTGFSKVEPATATSTLEAAAGPVPSLLKWEGTGFQTVRISIENETGDWEEVAQLPVTHHGSGTYSVEVPAEVTALPGYMRTEFL